MNIYAPRMSQVRYLNKNGYEADRIFANRHLQEGMVYLVERTEVDNWHTDVYLIGFPNTPFNSAMFEDVPEPEGSA